MTNIDKAIEILRKTNDGEILTGDYLYLVQCAVNGCLSDAGQEKLDELYKEVNEGKYVKPWHFGFEGVTKDLQGYVYWRGIRIEHYSFRDYEKEKQATEFFQVCMLWLEENKLEINSTNYFYACDILKHSEK
jgi:regulator of RNase E activity RraB